ncbi:MAG: hypothetical protein WC614_01775 [bacterium]
MNIERLVDKHICLLNTENPVESPEVQKWLLEQGFSLIITVGDYDCTFSWGLDTKLRHYQCSFSDYKNPTKRDLQDLNEYCLYELVHGRKVPIWFEDSKIRNIVADSIRTFFHPGIDNLDAFIQKAMKTQRDRRLVLPEVEKLTRCRFCTAEGCLTDMLCHGTSVETAKKILASGCILSACKALNMPGEFLANGPRNAAGDPSDYFEYIMFTAGNCPSPDKVVYERIIGRVPTWEEFEENFQPAVKFFFRTIDLTNHPEFCCDGLHMVKIHNQLDLEPLLVMLLIPEGLPKSSELIKLAEEKNIITKVIFRNFSGYTPKTWAHMAYLEAKQLK